LQPAAGDVDRASRICAEGEADAWSQVDIAARHIHNAAVVGEDAGADAAGDIHLDVLVVGAPHADVEGGLRTARDGVQYAAGEEVELRVGADLSGRRRGRHVDDDVEQRRIGLCGGLAARGKRAQ
jgi:hypothetical protein